MQAHSGVKGGRSHGRGLAAGIREPTDQDGAGQGGAGGLEEPGDTKGPGGQGGPQ